MQGESKMEGFNYDQQLAAAREAADRLKPKLEERILGQYRPAWQCNCGAISHAESEAVEVVPAGRKYEGQIGLWFLWTVKMRHRGQTEGYNYSCVLSEFLPVDEIEAMFSDAFKGIDTRTLEIESYKRNPLLTIRLQPLFITSYFS